MLNDASVRCPQGERGPRWSLDPCTRHLNHGSFGAVPVAVQEEQERLRRLMEWNPVRWFATLAERIADARAELAQLLAVERESLALVPNVSAGVSVVYASLLGAGPVDVVVTDHGYGAVTMGAERLARRTGGRCRVVPIPLEASASQVVELLEPALAQRPHLLVIDQVTSPTARALPAAEVCAMARGYGVRTLVDGAHAPGVLDDPVCREADYWVGNLHKFACAPRGTAVLVARDGGQELYPLIDSWGAREPFPHRFDHQGTIDATAWLCAPFAWRHIEETIGWAALRQEASRVLDEGSAVVAEALAAVVADPVPDVGQPVGLMRLLRLPAPLARDRETADALRVPFSREAGVAVSFTSFHGEGYLRLSAHAYNQHADFVHLANAGVPLLCRWAREQAQEEVSRVEE